jgi:hypothetical protein
MSYYLVNYELVEEKERLLLLLLLLLLFVLARNFFARTLHYVNIMTLGLAAFYFMDDKRWCILHRIHC